MRRSEKKWADRFEFHQMDITKEPEKLKKLIAQCDTVVNLAAICNPSEYIKQPVNTIRSNYNDAQVSHDAATATRTHALPCPQAGRAVGPASLLAPRAGARGVRAWAARCGAVGCSGVGKLAPPSGCPWCGARTALSSAWSTRST